MKFLNTYREIKEVMKEAARAHEAGVEAYAEAFAKAARMPEQQTRTRNRITGGSIASTDTGFRVERTLSIKGRATFGTIRYMLKRLQKENEASQEHQD